MKHKFILLSLLLVLLLPNYADAATLLIGDKISVEADDIIEDDYYVSVGSLGTTVMSGEVRGDMYSFAGSVTANGTIDGDFGSVSGLTYMHASVTDDVRIVAGEAVIDDFVGGDVFVLAGSLKILSTAQIEGDVIFYGFEAEINGEVGGSIYGSANSLRIDSKVGDDVDVNVTGELTLGSKANVAGDIRYSGFNKLVRSQEATIGGEIQKQTINEPTAKDMWRNILVPLLVSLFATLTLYLLFKKEIQVVVKTILRSPLPSGLVGLATLAAGPFVSLLLISTVLGMLLGIFGVGAMLILVAVGFSLAIVFTGALLARLLVGKPTVSLMWILFGAIVFHAILQIPVIGLLIGLALVSMAVGGVLLSLYRTIT